MVMVTPILSEHRSLPSYMFVRTDLHRNQQTPKRLNSDHLRLYSRHPRRHLTSLGTLIILATNLPLVTAHGLPSAHHGRVRLIMLVALQRCQLIRLC